MTSGERRPTRFDDPLVDDVGSASAGFGKLRADWLVFGIAVVLSVAALLVALGFVAAIRVAALGIDRMVRASPITVILVPNASSDTGRAIRDRLAGTPGVASATWIGKEEALRQLAGGSERVRILSGNPLPDVVIVNLRAAPGSKVVRGVVESLRGEANVEAIRQDAAWMSRLDDWSEAARSGMGRTAGYAALLVASVGIAGLWGLAVAALASSPTPGAAALIALGGSAIAVLVTLGLEWSAIGWAASPDKGVVIETVADGVRESLGEDGPVMAASALALAVIGGWIGARR